MRILDVGCARGRLGKALKDFGPPGRQVFGIERNEEAAAAAAKDLDAVYRIDVTRESPSIEPGSLDCILFGDVLEHLYDPLSVIRALRIFLKEDGIIICSIPNAQNHSVISALFTNDFQYKNSGLLDRDHIRFFTLSSIYKMLLDAEFLPRLLHGVLMPCSNEFLQAALPLAKYFRISPEQIHTGLSYFQYIVSGVPLSTVTQVEEPMSFVVCSNDTDQLENNLAASPCFRAGRHELVVIENASSAAEGINSGLSRASHDLVVAAHQDVYIPEGWPARLQSQWKAAGEVFGPLGMAGVFGVARQESGNQRTGLIVDTAQLRAPSFGLPTPAVSLDEVVLVFPRQTNVRLDPALGWHCYGTDAVLQTQREGLQAAILEVPCLHNSRFSGLLQKDFVTSARVLGEKWKDHRPIYTTCTRVDADGVPSGW